MPKTKSLSRGVAMVGAGMSKFGAFPEKTSRDVFVEAFQSMRKSVDKDFDPADIETIYIGNFSSDLFESQGHTAPIMADVVGLASRSATRVEDACASSGVALRQGILAIASGLYDVALVGGIEKMTNLPTAEVTDILAAAADTVYEIPAGFTFPGFYAAIATAYMHKYGMTPEHLMNVAIKNHENVRSTRMRNLVSASRPGWRDAKLPRRKRASPFLPGRMKSTFCTTTAPIP